MHTAPQTIYGIYVPAFRRGVFLGQSVVRTARSAVSVSGPMFFPPLRFQFSLEIRTRGKSRKGFIQNRIYQLVKAAFSKNLFMGHSRPRVLGAVGLRGRVGLQLRSQVRQSHTLFS